MAILDIRTGKPLTRRDALKGGLAAIISAGCAPALVGAANGGGCQYRGMAARIGSVGGSGGGPYDYEVEYLESHGSEYIDTGFVLSVTSELSCDLMPTEIAQRLSMLNGANPNAGESFSLITFGVKWIDWAQRCYVVVGFFNRTFEVVVIDAVARIVFDLKIKNCKYYVKVNGETQSNYYYGGDDKRFSLSTFLFARNNNGVADCFCKERIYSFKMTDVNKSMDMIPVVKDGVGYMYDRVSRKLFANQGSGAFTWGEK